jgi:DNA primase catalytic core
MKGHLTGFRLEAVFMARIPEEVIERLKQEVSLERLVAARGIELKRHGKDLVGLCPFHDDHSPSLVVTPAKNVWNCLGACQQGGDVIQWVMKAQGISFRHAVELLRADHPSLSEASAPVRISTVRKLAPPISREAGDGEALLQVVNYYHETLKQNPEAQAYLAKRGLRSAEMIEHFRLGFANRTLGLRLPPNNRKTGAELRGRLQKLGIIRESGHEHFNGCIVFPVFDRAGQVVEIYGRKIADHGLTPGTPVHLYLPGPHRGVWNEVALEAAKEIILCESIIDALTFWCAGYRNVTASFGVNGFTEDHRAALKKYETKLVLIAYDRDEAGEKAAAALASELMGMGIECFRVLFPKGMDANEYGLKVTPASKSLGVVLNTAHWLGKGQTPERETVEIVAPVESEPVVSNDPVPLKTEEPEPAAKRETGKGEESKEPVFSLAADAAIADVPLPSIRSAAPSDDLAVEMRPHEIIFSRGDRRYRVRGFAKNLSYEVIKVNLMASRGDGFHVDTLNLYAAHQCTAFIKQAAIEMGLKEDVIRTDLKRLLGKLEQIQHEQITQTLEPKNETAALDAGQYAAAMKLLEDPHLMDRILEDFARCGVVGEETNKKVAYLAAVSRLMESPLAVVVQSSSAAGKSSLMEAVLSLMPEDQRVQYSAMTGQALFYMGQTDLKNKILAIVEEEGAQRAAYALKLLQSEGTLTIASTGKDAATGKLVTHQYCVEGPVMIFLTTTAIEVDEELLNRCLVLTVDEDREQTRAIHRIQRQAQTLAGLLARSERQNIMNLHRTAQRLLKPFAVVNPFADKLSFPDGLTRTRRDHMKFLTLIRAITLLHQYQRPVQTVAVGDKVLEYIESTLSDINLAAELIRQVLGRSLDELPPQTRRMLLLIDDMVRDGCERLQMERRDYRFSRRDVRQHTGWSDAQVKRHLRKLEELEYLIVHHGGRGQSIVYELFFERPADPSQPFLPGLIEIEKLQIHNYEGNLDGQKGEKDGSNTPQVRPMFGGGTGAQEPIKTGTGNGFHPIPEKKTDTGGSPKINSVVVVGM